MKLDKRQLDYLRGKGMIPPETKPPKYRNRKTEVDGETFDSAKEAQRIQELRLLERAGEIRELQTQVSYLLIPAQKRNDGSTERAVHYIADATYWVGDVQVVEDTKSAITRKDKTYILKRKLMLWVHGITVTER